MLGLTIMQAEYVCLFGISMCLPVKGNQGVRTHTHYLYGTQLIYCFLSDRPAHKVYLRPDSTFAVSSRDNYVCADALISFH